MLKRAGKIIATGSLGFVLLTSLGVEGALAAKNENPQGIPQRILDLAESKVEETKLPEVKAWETDTNGNVKEVVPLSERMSTYTPPNDGYKYSFDTYVHSSGKKNWHYRNAGTFRVNNALSNAATMKYIQQSTATTKWSVSGSISGSATIGNTWIGAVEVELGGTVGRDKTDSEGKTYQVDAKVPAKSVAYLTNYHVGAASNGTLRYKKYSSGGSQVGIYTENAGGTGISKSDVNVELTAVEPL